MISQVTSRARRTSHKHGIEMPANLKHATKIHSRNKSSFWRDIIAKEMSSTRASFDALETGKSTHVVIKITSSHTKFDAKMDFTSKAKCVLDWHGHPSPEGSVHDGLVSQASVRIAFTWVAKK